MAGLQALATAKRLGARTTGYDVRPEVADQVRSVGAQWLDLGIDAAGEGATPVSSPRTNGPAAEAARRGDRWFRRGHHHRPGAGAPGAAVGDGSRGPGHEARKRGGRPAGETGGNCELTEPGKTVVKHG